MPQTAARRATPRSQIVSSVEVPRFSRASKRTIVITESKQTTKIHRLAFVAALEGEKRTYATAQTRPDALKAILGVLKSQGRSGNENDYNVVNN